MKRCHVLNSIVILCLSISIVTTSKATASILLDHHNLETIQPTQSHEIIATQPSANTTLFAKKRGSNYEDFILKTDDNYQSYPDWKNVTNPTYAPMMYFDDINEDGKKELTIILTTGYGTEILQQQIHVLHEISHTAGKVYQEVLVDNPITIVLKNVDMKLSVHEAEITIGWKRTVVNIDRFNIHPSNLFSDVSVGNYAKFDVVGHKLIATVGLQISPAAFIGVVKITYEYKNKLYQAKRIEFIPE